MVDRPCMACVVGLFEECHYPKEVEGQPDFIIPCAVWLGAMPGTRVEKERGPIGRPLIDPSESKDPISAGRKRAASLHPILEGMVCEWAGLKHAGGGKYPLVGCAGNLLHAYKVKNDGDDWWQGDLHHGPDKNTFHNTPGVNLHAICNQCVTGEMRLLMKDLTWKRADEIQVGDEIVGFDEDLRSMKMKPAVITDVRAVREPAYRITMTNGDVLTAGHAHQWVASRPSDLHIQWKSTESLREQGSLRKFLDPWETEHTYEAGWLAGFLDGEGHLGQSHLSAAQAIEGDNEIPAQTMLDEFERRFDGRVNYVWREYENRKKVLVVRGTNLSGILGLLGRVRPSRLLAKAEKFWEGKKPIRRGNVVEIKSIEYIGEQEVYSIETSSSTYIVEGYLSHNCHKRWHELNDPAYSGKRPSGDQMWTPDGEYYGHDPVTASTEDDREVNEQWWDLPVRDRGDYPFSPPENTRKHLTTPSDLSMLAHNPFSEKDFDLL